MNLRKLILLLTLFFAWPVYANSQPSSTHLLKYAETIKISSNEEVISSIDVAIGYPTNEIYIPLLLQGEIMDCDVFDDQVKWVLRESNGNRYVFITSANEKLLDNEIKLKITFKPLYKYRYASTYEQLVWLKFIGQKDFSVVVDEYNATVMLPSKCTIEVEETEGEIVNKTIVEAGVKSGEHLQEISFEAGNRKFEDIELKVILKETSSPISYIAIISLLLFMYGYFIRFVLKAD